MSRRSGSWGGNPPVRVARRRRERREAHQGQRDRWLVSYADFITLLFAFFTTLYGVSTVDAQKLESMVDALQHAFAAPGPAAAAGDPVPAVPLPVHSVPLIDLASEQVAEPGEAGTAVPPLSDALATLTRELQRELGAGRVELSIDRRGVVISIRETGSFAVGSAEPSWQAKATLQRVVETLRELENPVRVEGHTDDVPIHTARFASNWELSTARATSVVSFLVREGGLDPRRLSAAGYGEFRPRVPNESPFARARNRRVDLVILNETTAEAEEPGAALSMPAPSEP